MVGHADEITAMLSQGEDPAAYQIVAADSDTDCAAKALCVPRGRPTS